MPLVSDNAEQLNEFGRVMHAARAPQSTVTAALGYVRNLAAAETQRITAADNRDRVALANDMKIAWGNDYQLQIQAINSFLDRLPPVVEDAITNARTASGSKLLNTPEALEWLSSLATGHTSRPAAEVPPRSRAERLLDFEKLIKTDRRRYFKDAAMQPAYRQALSQDDTPEPLPRATAQIESEIRELEQRMKTNRKAYFKDAGAQTRYRTLISNERQTAEDSQL